MAGDACAVVAGVVQGVRAPGKGGGGGGVEE